MSEARPPYYPAFIDIAGRMVVVVGEGELAERKALRLLKYGADVTVISPDPTERLRREEAEGRLSLVPRAYAAGDLLGALVVICASSDPQVNQSAAAEARTNNSLVNIASDVPASSYLIPGIVNRGTVQIAVSTAGQAPELSKVIRRRVAQTIGPEWDCVVGFLEKVRVRAGEQGYTRERLARAVEWMLEGDVLQRVLDGRPLTARAALSGFESAETQESESA